MRLRDEIGKRTAELRIHGGRIDMAASLYPSVPQPWIDLSTGINPICWPVPQLPCALYQRLPLAREMAQLTAAAAETYGLPANAVMIPVPGSEIAIRLLPRMNGARRAGILAPTYGSHATAWRDAGAEVHELDALPDLRRHDLEMLIVVNPNNPDGRTIARADLTAFALARTVTGRRLVVDEAFADVRPEVSLLALPKLPVGTAVLRSLGFTRQQVRSVVGWPAGTLTGVALALGVPAGILCGRVAWRVFAHQLGILPVIVLPVLALGVLVAAALALAVAIGAVPGEAAARTRPAEILRSE